MALDRPVWDRHDRSMGTTAQDKTGERLLWFDEGELAEARRIHHLLMAMDGSPRAARALVQIHAFGRAIGADVETVEIVDEDPVDGLVTRFAFGDQVLGCIATHGRDRSGILVGSVAHDVLDRLDEPVLLVGPESNWNDEPNAPVVAAVDGSPEDASIAGVAAGWAARLHRPLHLVTVTELAPDRSDGGAPRRSHGPDRPAEHLECLATFTRGHGVDTTVAVIDDPVVVAGPVVTECVRVRSGLLVLGAVRHRGLRRIVVGSHAARIVHHSPALVLAVPLGLRG